MGTINIVDIVIKFLIFIAAVVSPFFTSYLTAKWSLRKFYAEKWWERKERAYSEIISAINDILQYFEYNEEWYTTGFEPPEEKVNELKSLYHESLWRLKKAKSIGEFVISKKAVYALKELDKLPKLNPNENPPEDVWYQDYKNHEQTLKTIIEIAKKDLETTRIL